MKKELSGIAIAFIFVVTSLLILAITSTINTALKNVLIASTILGAVSGLIAALNLMRRLHRLQSRTQIQLDNIRRLDAEVQQIHVLVKRVEALEIADENTIRQQTKLFDLVLNKNV
jgi:hypothetical protein